MRVQLFFLLVAGIWAHVVLWRHATPRGLERLRDLEPLRARQLLDGYTNGSAFWVPLVYGAMVGVGTLVAAMIGDWVAVSLGTTVAIVVLTVPLSLRRSRPAVVAVLGARHLPPLLLRERSARRTRRMWQWGAAALTASLVAPVCFTLAERLDEHWLEWSGTAAAVVALAALLGLAWAAAWRYGDEEPVEDEWAASAEPPDRRLAP